MIRVLVTDDHPVFRFGLTGLLDEADGIEVVGEAADGDAAVALVRELAPDVVLMDLNMAGAGGIDATRRILELSPQTAVLVLTMSEDDESVHAALRVGARGYLVKGAAGERIVTAVRAVAEGDVVLGAAVAAAAVERIVARSRTSRQGPFPMLTAREEQVLDLIARGWSNAEIARHLVVSDKTVRNTVSSIFAKLAVPDRARAIVRARDAGLGAGPDSS